MGTKVVVVLLLLLLLLLVLVLLLPLSPAVPVAEVGRMVVAVVCHDHVDPNPLLPPLRLPVPLFLLWRECALAVAAPHPLGSPTTMLGRRFSVRRTQARCQCR